MALHMNIGREVTITPGSQSQIQAQIAKHSKQTGYRYHAQLGDRHYLFPFAGKVVPLSLANLDSIREHWAIYGNASTYYIVYCNNGSVVTCDQYDAKDLEPVKYLTNPNAVHVYGAIGDSIRNDIPSAVAEEFKFFESLPDYEEFEVVASEVKGGSSSFGKLILLILCLSALGLFAYFELLHTQEPKASKQDIETQRMSHYQQFNVMNAGANLHLQLQGAEEIINRLSDIDGWLLQSCTADGFNVSCKLMPTNTARTSTLRDLVGVSVFLGGSVAEVSAPIDTSFGRFQASGYAAPLKQVTDLFFDRVKREALPDAINHHAYEKQVGLEKQTLEISRAIGPLGFLLFVAESAKGLPVKLQNMEVTKTGTGFSFRIEVFVYSTYEFTPTVKAN